MKQTISKRLVVINLAILSTIAGVVFMSAASYAASTKPPKIYSATCAITNVPTTLAIGQSMTPAIKVTNTGNYTIGAHFISFVDNNDGPTTYFKEINVESIKPGESKTKSLGKYTVPPNVTTTGTNNASVFAHSDPNYTNTKAFFQCSADFTIVQ